MGRPEGERPGNGVGRAASSGVRSGRALNRCETDRCPRRERQPRPACPGIQCSENAPEVRRPARSGRRERLLRYPKTHIGRAEGRLTAVDEAPVGAYLKRTRVRSCRLPALDSLVSALHVRAERAARPTGPVLRSVSLPRPESSTRKTLRENGLSRPTREGLPDRAAANDF